MTDSLDQNTTEISLSEWFGYFVLTDIKVPTEWETALVLFINLTLVELLASDNKNYEW